MGITRLNHAVLYVSDVDRSRRFYSEVLGFQAKSGASAEAVFARAAGSDNDHDLALFRRNLGQQRSGPFSPNGEAPGPNEPAAGLYHLAWEVDSLAELERIRDELARLGILGMEEDHGVHKSVYGRDPDGLLFEVAWFPPAELLTDEDRSRPSGPLDFAAEKRRFGGK
ncbi:VOC family protein [Paludibacterium paludis]|uniref:Glyoxalase n=1 Tax=Paludibacterium paludis TaxID=1225769 RepID=A0A918P625_9NEIS|nr:VOC family protein [Paludibacterium paludis]GGY24059.1 glyoxalase [Paludibacterium paludis]